MSQIRKPKSSTPGFTDGQCRLVHVENKLNLNDLKFESIVIDKKKQTMESKINEFEENVRMSCTHKRKLDDEINGEDNEKPELKQQMWRESVSCGILNAKCV